MAKDSSVKPAPKRRGSRLGATIKALVRTRITAGVIVVLPIYVTFLLIKWIFGVMRDSSLWVVEFFLRSQLGKPLLDAWKVPMRAAAESTTPGSNIAVGPTTEHLVRADKMLITVTDKLSLLEARLDRPVNLEEFFQILPEPVQIGTAIFSVLLTIFLLYIIGLFAANLVGRRTLEILDRIVERVPLVKTVYRSIKQMLSTLTGDQSQSFQRVALVPFPHEKMRCVGFITNIFTDSVTGDELCSVFIPTTPNPTTGYLQILKRGDITEMDCTVEDGFRTIMSAGILKPEFLTILPNKELPPELRTALPTSPPPDQPPDGSPGEA